MLESVALSFFSGMCVFTPLIKIYDSNSGKYGKSSSGTSELTSEASTCTMIYHGEKTNGSLYNVIQLALSSALV